jgi:hypothetical protein
MPISAYDKVSAVTLSLYAKEIVDNVTTQKVLLWDMGRKGAIITRSGGERLVFPVFLSDNPTVKSYTDFEQLDMTVSDGPRAAEYEWKSIAGVAQLSGMQMFKNSGSATQVADLWTAEGDNLAISMRNTVNAQLFSDGANGKDIIGLLAAVENGDAWSTYGGINSNTVTNWRNNFVDVAGIDSAGSPNAAEIAIFRKGMVSLVNGTLSGGGGRPHLIVTTQTLHEYWENNVLIPNEKYDRIAQDEDMARSGFENFVFKGVPVTWDADMLPNTTGDDGQGMVALNFDYLKFCMGEGADFKFGDIVVPDNQDAQSVKCILYSNLITTRRRSQGRADFDTSSSS